MADASFGAYFEVEDCKAQVLTDDVGEGWPDKDGLGITILKIEVPSVTDYVDIEKL